MTDPKMFYEMAALAEASYVFFDRLKGVFSTEAGHKGIGP